MKRVLVVTHAAPGRPPGQGAILAARLAQEGIAVGLLSRARSSWGRALDVAVRGFLRMLGRDLTVIVDVFGGRAFLYESLAVIYARLLGRRLVVVLHGGWMPEIVERWPRWYRAVLRLPHEIVAPSAFLLERLTSKGLRVDGVIPNFIEPQKFLFRRRGQLRPRFLYLRGLHSIYNPEMALEAFARVQAEVGEASLTMGGGTPTDSDGLQRRAQELNLRNVRFIGVVPKDQIPSLADQHDIYIQTTRIDNMPVTVLEMWAAGLPVVATNVGGIPYLVRDGVDGLLVPSERPEALADACLRLLRDPGLAERLSENGRRRAEEHSWDSIAPAWRKTLDLA